jgi:hypothetical protein
VLDTRKSVQAFGSAKWNGIANAWKRSDRRATHFERVIMQIKAAVKDILTGKDGQTHDLGRWSWLASTVTIIGGGIWNAVHGNIINLMELAQAIGVVVAAHGGALWAKRDTEPPAPPPPQGQ